MYLIISLKSQLRYAGLCPMNYHNPIIPGFAPDPSVIFVESEGTFFLVNSSFHFYPGLPIYASNDLQDWVHIGKLGHI